MTSGDLECVRACEERIVNCWPAAETLLIDGFVVRFANGYSGRANSASPIVPGADLADATLDEIEALYARAGLPPLLRLTPLAADGLGERIEGRGYRLRDASHGMLLPLTAAPAPEPLILLQHRPDGAWLDGVSRLQGGAKKNPAHLEAIVGRLRVPAGFATAMIDGEAAGYGMTAIDRGMAEIGSIIIDPAHRGRGVGRKIVLALMRQARMLGAHTAFLQVDVTNATAIRLYESLGFRRLYRYRTMEKAAE